MPGKLNQINSRMLEKFNLDRHPRLFVHDGSDDSNTTDYDGHHSEATDNSNGNTNQSDEDAVSAGDNSTTSDRDGQSTNYIRVRRML